MTPKKVQQQAPMYQSHIGESGRVREMLAASLESAIRPLAKHTQTVDDSSLAVVLGSTIGPRRQRNEDRVCAVTISRGPAPRDQAFVAVVCDGIGGQKNGEESAWKAASRFIAECAVSNKSEPKAILRDAVVAADDAVYSRNRGQGGTTLVALLLLGDGQVACVNCGDSRLYKIAQGGKLIQLSHDQTIGAAIQGVASYSPISSAFDSELGNYIGIGPDMTPEFVHISHIAKEDAFILATDGTWGSLGNFFEPILHVAPSATEAVRRVLATVNYVNGGDNASMAVIWSFETLRSALRKKSGRSNVIDIAGITPGGPFYVSANRPMASDRPMSSDVRGTRVDQSERGKTSKKGPRSMPPSQSSLGLESRDGTSTAQPKKKRRGGGGVIVLGGQDGDTGEDGH